MPQVTIGTLDRTVTDRGPLSAVRAAAPFASAEAFCRAHLATEGPLLAALQAKERSVHLDEMKPYCSPPKIEHIAKQTLGAPFEKIGVVSLMEADEMVERLVVKTDRGWYPTAITFAMEFPGPGCGMSGGYLIDSAAVEKGALVLHVSKYAAYQMASPQNFEVAAAFFVACKPDAAGVPVCREELLASFDGDGAWTWRMKETQKWDVHPPRWDWKREASIDDDGQIRLSPCVDAKGAASSCGRRNADLLRRF